MEPTLAEVIKFLRDNRYLLINKGKYSLSKSFHDDKAKLSDEPYKPGATYEVTLIPKGQDWQMLFLKLIREAKVPARCDDGKGNYYETNKYSEDGMKVFRTAIEKRGMNYDILVKSTMLYYHSSTRFKKKIGNYFIDGDWLSDYNTLASKAEEGEQAVIDHIKQETKDGQHNPWT